MAETASSTTTTDVNSTTDVSGVVTKVMSTAASEAIKTINWECLP